jgi:isoamylase
VFEFKTMVKALHAAGLEVILDVVYNHTAEGNHLGPTLSFKGIDNATYYRISEEDRRFYVDYTGTGNTVNTHQPVALRMIMDSLRYWVTEMHVDGFRFDLASTLGRSGDDFDLRGGFFAAVGQDPVLAGVKLIAEPWDVGSTGYQVGGFPTGWAEWNGKYRDSVRSFWKGDEGALAEFSHRLCGSSDLYDHSERNPNDSVNIVTVHDGFTLRDLVTYNEKHNDANGEGNRDGEGNNHSWNCGAEGPTDDAGINELRERQQRNMLTTLFMSQGTPLLLGGDELGRTQRGNNNGYCQDNEISWVDWKDPSQENLLPFVRKLIALRKTQPALRRSTFFTGQADEGGHRDITWLNPTGEVMMPDTWNDPNAHTLSAVLCGRNTGEISDDGKPVLGASVLLLVNAYHETVNFKLPQHHVGDWQAVIDTKGAQGDPERADWKVDEEYPVDGRSMVVLIQEDAPETADESKDAT